MARLFPKLPSDEHRAWILFRKRHYETQRQTLEALRSENKALKEELAFWDRTQKPKVAAAKA